MINLDYSEFQCPYPVVETRKQMLANPGETISVLVGDQTAKENVSRLAEKMGYQVNWQSKQLKYELTLTPAGEEAAPQPQPVTTSSNDGDTVIYCGSDTMGQGDPELGRILLKNFLATLLEMDPLPDTIFFVNSGVNMVCSGSEALEALNTLACKGVDIASCGLCLDFYNLQAEVQVGRVTNMFDTVETQMRAARVICP
ncbi:selenium metabolism protein YedF [Malonomonas rubra DSM 5091]|uniref:Selenium metabolism protein YedF n=1 Tax=Malonomonas rubra DSM 5091 TaxID=1122189 RepID=A0A1M6J6Z1_MALRU|nr:sulfurtransferase-like selenium metabolism protein YedF [Malonomonas rubra]SHJ42429.1 selenium metabolism protein YedF [Malonomonas rubra DSM 5091]